MEAKEKAKELVDKYEYHSKPMEYGMNFSGDIDHAKQCALICVDEILKENERINQGGYFPTPLTEYWQEVKQEINKL